MFSTDSEAHALEFPENLEEIFPRLLSYDYIDIIRTISRLNGVKKHIKAFCCLLLSIFVLPFFGDRFINTSRFAENMSLLLLLYVLPVANIIHITINDLVHYRNYK